MKIRLNRSKILFPFTRKYTFELGAITCIVGPNASGKTSVLRLVERALLNKKEEVQMPMFSGSKYKAKVELESKIPVWYDPSKYGAHVNLQEQDIDVKHWLNLSMFRMSEAECRGLYFTDFFESNKEQLLKGECLILIDEPENSLDKQTLDAYFAAVKSCTKLGTRVLITTHSLFVLKHADMIIELATDYKRKLIDDWLSVAEELKGINE